MKSDKNTESIIEALAKEMVAGKVVGQDIVLTISNFEKKHGFKCGASVLKAASALVIKKMHERKLNKNPGIKAKQDWHEVIVGNVGAVYAGPNKTNASKSYNDYVELSKLKSGSASGEPVVWMINSAPHKEYVPGQKESLLKNPSVPTPSDRADFKKFCEQATTRQLGYIIEKEKKANRRVYAKIASSVLEERESRLVKNPSAKNDSTKRWISSSDINDKPIWILFIDNNEIGYVYKEGNYGYVPVYRSKKLQNMLDLKDAKLSLEKSHGKYKVTHNPAKHKYEVIVGNIGSVYSGGSHDYAMKHFRRYKDLSKSNEGRAAGEDVNLVIDGEIAEAYLPNAVKRPKLQLKRNVYLPPHLKEYAKTQIGMAPHHLAYAKGMMNQIFSNPKQEKVEFDKSTAKNTIAYFKGYKIGLISHDNAGFLADFKYADYISGKQMHKTKLCKSLVLAKKFISDCLENT